jgi:PhnB protein
MHQTTSRGAGPAEGAVMKLAHFYLNFPGTAKEAFAYYESVFGTKIVSIQTFRETPYAGPVPSGYEDKIMHVQLPITETVHLMGSDSVPGYGPLPVAGNNFYVMVVAGDKAEADRVFAALSSGGKTEMPLANAPWGPYFGMCQDKFGIQWMVSLDHSA